MWRWNIARSSQRFDRRAECAALVYWPRIGPTHPLSQWDRHV